MTTPFMPGMVSYHATAGKGPVRVEPPPVVPPAVGPVPTNTTTRSATINLDPPTPSEPGPRCPRHGDGADQAHRTDPHISIDNDESVPGGRLPQ
jgi:hypothetical protein